MKRTILLAYATILLTLPANAAEPNAHTIENVDYYPMLDGYCAMTALRMNLHYYGVDVDQSTLLNLGWNYGFFFIDSPFYTGAYPCTEPVAEIIHAANLLGFKTEFLVHASLDEARQTLVKYISQDIPVIIQWTPHTVLAYGYQDNARTVIVHNPGQPTPDLVPKTRWQRTTFPIADWLQPPILWQFRGFQMVVITPDTKTPNIDWKQIWARAAAKTLGIDKGDQPGYSGTPGIETMIKYIQAHAGQNDKKSRENLHNFKMTFELGAGFRRNASAFLAGFAAASNDQNLTQAALHLRASALLFRQGQTLLEHSKSHPNQQPQIVKELTQILHAIINEETAAAQHLQKASQ